MFKINCYKEKCALVAYYFCGKEKILVKPEEVFGIWKSWWKNDYIGQNHSVYKISNGKLVTNKKENKKDDPMLKEYNKVFQRSYKWITDYVTKHSKEEARENVVKQRVRQLAELKSLAGKKNLKAFMPTRNVKSGYLAHYLLVGENFRKDGNYESLLQYLNNI